LLAHSAFNKASSTTRGSLTEASSRQNNHSSERRLSRPEATSDPSDSQEANSSSDAVQASEGSMSDSNKEGEHMSHVNSSSSQDLDWKFRDRLVPGRGALAGPGLSEQSHDARVAALVDESTKSCGTGKQSINPSKRRDEENTSQVSADFEALVAACTRAPLLAQRSPAGPQNTSDHSTSRRETSHTTTSRIDNSIENIAPGDAVLDYFSRNDSQSPQLVLRPYTRWNRAKALPLTDADFGRAIVVLKEMQCYPAHLVPRSTDNNLELFKIVANWVRLEDLQRLLGGDKASLEDQELVYLCLSHVGWHTWANPDDMTILHWACHRGEDATVAWLLDHDADIEELVDIRGSVRTPLCTAAMVGRDSTVKLLLDRGARIENLR